MGSLILGRTRNFFIDLSTSCMEGGVGEFVAIGCKKSKKSGRNLNVPLGIPAEALIPADPSDLSHWKA
jgi:hypothetical protein